MVFLSEHSPSIWRDRFIGDLLGWSLNTPSLPEQWRIPIATGFLGSLTTFSTFAVESITLMEGGQWKSAVIYLLSHLLMGLLLASCGLWIGRRYL